MEPHFWCKDPQTAAEAVRKRWPENVQHTLHLADEICRGRFLFQDHWEMERTHKAVDFGPDAAGIDWALVPFGDPEWLYAMNRHTSFVNLGKAWQLTRDPKYAARYAALLDDWIARVPLTPESESSTWRSLETGLRCENWLRAADLFADSGVLTPERRARMDACLVQHGEYLVRSFGVFHQLSNWGILQDCGLYLLGVYLGREEWCALAARRMDENLHQAVFADGSQWEQSPLYHCEVLHCALNTLRLARMTGRELPARMVANTHNMCRALVKWLKPNGELLLQSDSDTVDARDLLVLGAVLFEDAALRRAGSDRFFEENIWDFGPEAEAAYIALPKDPAPAASAALPDSGNYMLRGVNDSYVHFHCGCLGSGHGHADQLHIDAGLGGEDVLLDSGRYTYVNDPVRHALKGPAAHNTTRVDDCDFSTCLDSWGYSALATPLKGEYRFTDTADFVSAAHLGYLDKGLFTQRKLVFLKEQGVLLVFDQLMGKGQHTFEQNFHFGEGTLALDGQTARWQGSRTAAVLHCLGDGAALTARKAPYAREYNKLLEGDALTVRRTASDFNWFVTVLQLQPDAAAPELTAELLPVHKLRLQTPLTDAQAQAVRLVCSGQETVVLVCHGEVISEVDLLAAGNYAAYGKAIVFDAAHPQGLCLAW
ncbi:alginate lyase family protein [uncultured Gemmiger sp.]|uniref:alginate lyase family protein n=1 Tax=uncultured Gemmiger sp. TaxID=1623490 RepID=UPI0025DD8906|nr:alginate lyase family protein [uncultured Gemmiger sp.]